MAILLIFWLRNPGASWQSLEVNSLLLPRPHFWKRNEYKSERISRRHSADPESSLQSPKRCDGGGREGSVCPCVFSSLVWTSDPWPLGEEGEAQRSGLERLRPFPAWVLSSQGSLDSV